MRTTFLSLTIVALAIFISCSDNNNLPAVDCTQSDLTLSIIDQTSPDCVTEGSIEVAGFGGTGPYVFSINNGNFQTSNVLTGLSAGTHIITIKDANGCIRTGNAVLEGTGGAIELSVLAMDSECGNATGTINASAIGGNGNYMFSLDGGTPQASGQFTGVSNGSHTVSVTDTDGCSASRDEIVSSGTSWMNDIMPIINANCAVSGCHNGDNGQSRNWTVFSNVQGNASNIKNRTGAKEMPPPGSGRSLTDAEIELIACWVDDGAEEN